VLTIRLIARRLKERKAQGMWKMVVMQFEIEYSLRILGPVVRSCKQPEKESEKIEATGW
jgi:hypothetical protein